MTFVHSVNSYIHYKNLTHINQQYKSASLDTGLTPFCVITLIYICVMINSFHISPCSYTAQQNLIHAPPTLSSLLTVGMQKYAEQLFEHSVGVRSAMPSAQETRVPLSALPRCVPLSAFARIDTLK